MAFLALRIFVITDKEGTKFWESFFHTVLEEACLSMVVPLTRKAFAEKQPDLFVVFSTSSEKVLSFFLHKTTKRYSFINIFAELTIIVKLQKKATRFWGNDHNIPKK